MLLKTKLSFILILISTLITNAQFFEFGKPVIDNYTTKDYHRENQNYSVVQDTNGVMFFGNLNGVIKFDGESWNSIKLTGTNRLCRTTNGQIFVGAYKTFGTINIDNQGNMIYKDLSFSVTNAGFNFNKVKQMVAVEDKVIVNAPPHIFIIDSKLNVEYAYGDKNTSAQVIASNPPLILLEDSIVKLNVRNYELSKFELSHYSDVKKVFPWFDSYLIGFKSGIWQIFNDDFKLVSTLNTETQNILNKFEIDFGCNVSDKYFSLGTNNCGLIILDSLAHIVSKINQSNGLVDNDINALYKDNNNNIWLALNNGISVLEFPSSFSTFNNNYGLHGSVLDIIKFQNRMYIASTQGLFVSPQEGITENCNIPQFIRVKGIGLQCTSFLEFKDRLLITNALGIYELKNGIAVKISNLKAYKLIASKHYKNVIFAATHYGLGVLELSQSNITKDYLIPDFNVIVKTISETEDGNLWLGTEYMGLYYFDLHSKLEQKPTIKQYKELNKLPKNHGWVDVFETKKETYFSTDRGLFSYDKKLDKFNRVLLADTLKNRWYSPIVEDKHGNLWFSSGENTNYTNLTGIKYHIPNTDSSTIISIPFNPIKDYTIEAFYIDNENNVAWLGYNEGLIRFDTKKIIRETKLNKTILSKLIFGKDSIINPIYSNKKKIIKLPYEYNSIRIYASNNSYNVHDIKEFQFWLEGHEKTWSNWQKSSIEQYTGLSEGKYTIHTRSKNIYDEISETASYQFKIMPPIYRSIWAFIIYLLLLGLLINLLLRYRSYVYQKEKYALEKIIREKTEEIIIQKERAEDLVKSIIPEDTSKSLERKGRVSRKKYEMATVLFSDVQGFTQIAQDLNPDVLLDELDEYVMQFDSIVEQYNIEKIKTIGDAYMCAGGIPNKNITNSIDVVLAGLQMLHFSKEIQKKSENNWGVRFGIHTGPLIAGVIGNKKLSYDIWGDTVNIASRMESYGEVNQLNISHSTYIHVSEYFDCDYRGTLPVKHHGNMKMYFVRGLKFKYASDHQRITPNEKFLLKIQYIRFTDLENLVLTKLEKGLDEGLYYHDVKHTMDVVNTAEILGKGEGVNEEEILLLKTAALFHDLGHTINFIDHEEQGIVFAKDILPKYQYSQKQIEIISELIFATKFPPKPRNKLEEIICDADLDYLGRSDFIPSSHKLYLEMYEHGKINNIEEWNKEQVRFLKTHQYYTETARNAREINKIEQLRLLEEQIKKTK